MTAYAVREIEMVVEEVEAVAAEASVESPNMANKPMCAHYWIIEPANGPVSQGQCQNCLEVRDFKNFVDAYHQDDD